MQRQVLQAPLGVVARGFGKLLVGDVSDEETGGPVSQTYDRAEPALKPANTRRDLQTVFQDLWAAGFEHTADSPGDTSTDFVADRLARCAAELLDLGRDEQCLVRGPDRKADPILVNLEHEFIERGQQGPAGEPRSRGVPR